MGSQWHYIHDGKQFGPVTSPQLRQLAAQGHILPTDLLWKEGLPEWVPATKVRGLFGGAEGSQDNSLD